jgi:DNA-binding XRE family transcriptional regulator
MSRRTSATDIRVRFGFVVKTLRERLELTQEDLAEKAGIHRTYLSDIERGSRNVALVNIERLAISLNLTLQELFKRVDQVQVSKASTHARLKVVSPWQGHSGERSADCSVIGVPDRPPRRRDPRCPGFPGNFPA